MYWHVLHKAASLLTAATEDLPSDSGTAALLGDNRLLIFQHTVRVVKLSTDNQERIKSQEEKGMSAGKLSFFFSTNAVSIYHQPQESHCRSLVASLKGQKCKSASACIES